MLCIKIKLGNKESDNREATHLVISYPYTVVHPRTASMFVRWDWVFLGVNVKVSNPKRVIKEWQLNSPVMIHFDDASFADTREMEIEKR